MGQIKNIKLHIVTDIKLVQRQITITMVQLAAVSPVAVNNVLKAARYVALFGGIYQGLSIRKAALPVERAALKAELAEKEAAAKALEAKRAAEAAQPSILV